MFSGSMKTKIHSCLFLIYTECFFSPRSSTIKRQRHVLKKTFLHFMSFLCIKILQLGLDEDFQLNVKENVEDGFPLFRSSNLICGCEISLKH